jgi:cellulose synthase operon protein C
MDPRRTSVRPSGPKARTLPPPEWTEREGPRSAASLALEMHEADPPISRRLGPRAERGFYQARLAAAAAAGDAEGERAAAAALARTLATQGAELDTATKLARRALVLGDDPVLREELAGWFAMLGEPALAAATLGALVADQRGPRAAQISTRIAVLLGRAGDALGAAEALSRATREDGEDPVPPELLGSIGAWAPYAVPAERAAAAYVEGHRRRDARGERAAAFEDLLRAFEMAPSESEPAERLAQTLAGRGRIGAADEVRREHARSSVDTGRRAHVARAREFLLAGELPRAVGAAFDARLDAELDPERIARGLASAEPTFEQILERAGLHELLAARLELACEALSGRERAAVRAVLGRLYGGAVASAARAAKAWIDALVTDPEDEDAKAALRSHATTTRDSSPLVEALVRIGRGPARSGRAACLRELALLADQRLEDPGLASWAIELLRQQGADSDLLFLAERIEERKRRQDEDLLRARAELTQMAGAERRERLRRIASILRGRPEQPDACIAALLEVIDADPDERAWQLTLERVLAREGRLGDLEALLRSALSRATAGAERERLRLELSELRRNAQDWDGALRELMPLLEEGAAHPAACSMALLLAARLGDESTRAEALLRIAQPLSPTSRAILTSVAAEAWLLAGALDRARTAAQQATNVDPSLSRPTAVLAQIALLSGPTPEAADALERAMGVVVPRASLAEALAEAHEALGHPELSLMWTQRWLALRPGDPRAARTLLGRVTEAADAQRLGDALGWLLAQPQPLRPMAREIGAALLRLAELDRERGAAMARRALDVLGPRATELRDVLLAISKAALQPGLGIAVIERALAAGTQGADRAELLLDVAVRRKAAGDADGAAGALVRAIVEGAPPARVLEQLDSALPARSSDGEIALLEARAEAVSGLAGADLEGSARAWRELGAARWDLAGDADGAVRAWERAAALDPERGVPRFARDIVAFGGCSEALGRLEQLAAKKREPEEVARVLAVAATVALGAGEMREALRIAARALELDPSRTDVLAIAERAATSEDIELLERIYDVLSRATLGCYGERAVHYRAGRVLERHGELERALRHGIQAFEAVPARGVALLLITRLAERAGDGSEVIAAIERVAARAANREERAAWLESAAALATNGEEGRRQRVDVLLRALAVRPDTRTLEKLGAALGELIAVSPDYREVAELRLERAFATLLARVDGPEGARIAIAGCRVALDMLGSARLGLLALARALSADADVDEYASLLPKHAMLAAEPEAARGAVARLLEMAGDRYANVGRHALELGAALASELGDPAARLELLEAAVKRDPDDPALGREAELAARRQESAPDRIETLSQQAESADKRGDLPAAVDAWERVMAEPGAAAEVRECAVVRLRDLYARTGRRAELERLLASELERPELDPDSKRHLSRDLAAVVAAHGDPERALEIVAQQIQAHPQDAELLADAVMLARQTTDRRVLAEALAGLADLSSGSDKLALLHELAPLLEQIGEAPRAYARWAEVLALNPADADALAALERDADARGDFDAVIALLARRAALATRVEDVRRIRLRRATVLEQRLGHADEARAELESLLAATGDALSVLRVLADLDQRLGDSLRAAPLWLRASAITTDRAEASDLAQRACEAYLGGGDVAAARRVLEGLETWAHSERLLELRVEVERRSEDPHALGLALDELSRAQADPGRRARLLVEAARAHQAAGDLDAALECAGRAAKLAPADAEAQLCARTLEYLSRAAGTPEQARVTAAELRQIQQDLSPEQAELRAFLVAEALDVAVGSGAGMRELSRAQAELGPTPLLSLGMAERLLEGGEPASALSLFDVALGADLKGLRARGEVALGAARAAQATGDLDRAIAYVETAATDAATRAAALALGSRLRDALGERRGASGALPPAPLRPRPSTPPPRSASPSHGVASAVPATTRSEPPLPREEPEGHAVTLERASVRTPSVPPPADAASEPRTAPAAFRPLSDNEEMLLEALSRGSIEAGRELASQLENRSDRSQDLVTICRRVAGLLPGDRDALERLYEALLADKNLVYARAVEHVLKAFEPSAEPVVAPPLGDQPESSDAVRGMLLRDNTSAATEALALVWEGAGHVFRRDPGTYGVTGLERVPVGAPTPLARAYSGAARMLGARTPVFQRRSAGPVTLSIALLAPPAVIVSGEISRDSSQLRFHVGQMLAAAMPEHALLFGSVESQVRGILKALSLAFGPPQESHSNVTSIANLAEVLWESISTRAQRRLRELCDDPKQLDYTLAMATARRAVRRAGLLCAGDIKVALREACSEEGIAVSALEAPGGLASLCSASLAVADLVRFATSQEYAEARWQPVKSGSRAGSGSWAIS